MSNYSHVVTGLVTETKRIGTSVNGNPSYDVTMSNGQTYRTSSDSSLSYEITNRNFRNEAHTFELTAAGRLSGRYKSLKRPRADAVETCTVWSAGVGDVIIAGGFLETVTAIRVYPAGHSVPNIRSDYVAVEVMTTGATRYCGHNPEVIGSALNGVYHV